MADIYEKYRDAQLREIGRLCKDTKTCGSCRWWKWTDSWDGQCQRVHEKKMPFHGESRVGGLRGIGEGMYLIADTVWLHTGMHFGCNLWERQPQETIYPMEVVT